MSERDREHWNHRIIACAAASMASAAWRPEGGDGLPMNRRRLLLRILNGSRNVAFSDFVNLLEGFGFRQSQVRGSHHIYVHPDVPELVNVQDVGAQVKPYQVRQVLELIERHQLRLKDGREESP